MGTLKSKKFESISGPEHLGGTNPSLNKLCVSSPEFFVFMYNLKLLQLAIFSKESKSVSFLITFKACCKTLLEEKLIGN